MQYLLDRQTSQITFSWIPGGKAEQGIGVRVSELDVPAYRTDFDAFGELQVQMPRGMFKVNLTFLNLDIDHMRPQSPYSRQPAPGSSSHRSAEFGHCGAHRGPRLCSTDRLGVFRLNAGRPRQCSWFASPPPARSG
jgi:hypothetical protein